MADRNAPGTTASRETKKKMKAPMPFSGKRRICKSSSKKSRFISTQMEMYIPATWTKYFLYFLI